MARKFSPGQGYGGAPPFLPDAACDTFVYPTNTPWASPPAVSRELERVDVPGKGGVRPPGEEEGVS